MSLATMIAEQRGCVPKYSAMLARTHLREAYNDIRNLKGWSFQLGTSAIATPPAISNGTVTVQLGSPTVIGDAQATLQWLTASSPISFLSQRQFRVGAGTIYNIISYDDGQTASGDNVSPNYPFATLTLDRPYIDLVATNNQLGPNVAQGYSIYQCYYPTPVRGFLAWENVCDVTNVIWLKCNGSYADRQKVDRNDPQRQIFSNPGVVLPYEIDQRPGSATIGYPLYELYPQPQSQYVYQTWYSWEGPTLDSPSSTLPFPITEELVKAKARVKAYEWAEANKDPTNPRGAGADYRFVMGSALNYYNEQLKEIRMLDRDRVDMFYSVMSRRSGYGIVATFDPSTGEVRSRNM